MKVANCAWLIVSILNAFPAISVNSPLVVGTTLLIIILIGLLKEGITDYARHREDWRINNTPIYKMGNVDRTASNHKVTYTLKDVKVGDIVFLDNGQLVPADCVLLAVHGTAGSEQGYI